ncbi:Lys63-specific deubiquitinase [Aureococcus anophagefferens]|nr:Lys63-specific deubiquitinase [Aureococcus anophagefferens]
MAPVELAIYDLSGGAAKEMSASMGALLDNKTVELVPHTGVRVFGREVVFSGGIRAQDPTQVVEAMGHGPVRVEAMGDTAKTEDELDEFLCSIAASWTAESYDLWTKNCNNFSDVVLNFLCGRGVPAVQDALNGSLEKNGGLVGPKGETMTLTVKAASGSAAPTSVTLPKTATVGALSGVNVGEAPLRVVRASAAPPVAAPVAAHVIPTIPVPAATPLSRAVARAEASGGTEVLKTLHKILSNVVHHPGGKVPEAQAEQRGLPAQARRAAAGRGGGLPGASRAWASAARRRRAASAA